MISKFHYKIIIFIAFFCLIGEQSITASLAKNIQGALGITLGILLLNDLFQSSARDPYLYTPTDFKIVDEYLDFLDSKIKDWDILFIDPREDQINKLRKELIKSYKKQFSQRSILSIIIHADLTTHPWALLATEIEQHKTKLSWYKRNSVCNLCISSKTCEHLNFITNKIYASSSRLDQILDNLEYRTDFQSELSQARQEKNLQKMEHLLSAFFGFYMMYKLIDY